MFLRYRLHTHNIIIIRINITAAVPATATTMGNAVLVIAFRT